MPSYQDFHVTGPVKIQWAIASGTLADLGQTDNEDLVRISVRNHQRSFSRNDQGDMIGESVLSGSTAMVDFTMIAWNQEELVKLIERTRVGGTPAYAVGDEGLFATVGGVVVNHATLAKTIKLKITPTNTGAISYEFPTMILSSGPEYMDFGNTVKRVALSFTTIAPASGTVIMTTAAV